MQRTLYQSWRSPPDDSARSVYSTSSGDRQNGGVRKRVPSTREKCKAERMRDWELRGGVRREKLFVGKNGFQLHFMPHGGIEQTVKRNQRDWSLPQSSRLFGVWVPEALADNTYQNTYTFDGNDDVNTPFRPFETTFECDTQDER